MIKKKTVEKTHILMKTPLPPTHEMLDDSKQQKTWALVTWLLN